MSQAPSTSTSGTNFQTIFAAALNVYEKKTKRDLLSHPLATQLQFCDSPSAILAILKAQAQTFARSQSPDERLTLWLDPTVNVLYAFSAILAEGVGLVSARVELRRVYSLTCVAGIFTFKCHLCRHWDTLRGEQFFWPDM
jgi:hypothetical protein